MNEIVKQFPDWIPMPGNFSGTHVIVRHRQIEGLQMAFSDWGTAKATPDWHIIIVRQHKPIPAYSTSDVPPIVHVSAPDLEEAIALAKNEWRKVFDAIPPAPPFDPLEFYGCAINFVDGLTPKQQAALENVLGLLIEDEPEQFLGRVGDIRRYVSKSLRTDESKD